MLSNDLEPLVHYQHLAPHTPRAHPTEARFLPLLVAQGARAESQAAQVLDAGVANGVLSMTSLPGPAG